MSFPDFPTIIEETISVWVYRTCPEPTFFDRTWCDIAMKTNAQGQACADTGTIRTCFRAEAASSKPRVVLKAPIDALPGKSLVAALAASGCFGDSIGAAGV